MKSQNKGRSVSRAKRKAAKNPKKSRAVLRAEAEALEARVKYAHLWYQYALRHMLSWNGYTCRILAPIAALPFEDGSEISELDIGMTELRTGMLILGVDEDTVELGYTAGWP